MRCHSWSIILKIERWLFSSGKSCRQILPCPSGNRINTVFFIVICQYTIKILQSINMFWIESQSNCSQWTPRVLETLSRDYRSKFFYIEIIRHDLPFPLGDICFDGMKTIVGKTAGSWVQIKAWHHCPKSHCILHYHTLAGVVVGGEASFA